MLWWKLEEGLYTFPAASIRWRLDYWDLLAIEKHPLVDTITTPFSSGNHSATSRWSKSWQLISLFLVSLNGFMIFLAYFFILMRFFCTISLLLNAVCPTETYLNVYYKYWFLVNISTIPPFVFFLLKQKKSWTEKCMHIKSALEGIMIGTVLSNEVSKRLPCNWQAVCSLAGYRRWRSVVCGGSWTGRQKSVERWRCRDRREEIQFEWKTAGRGRSRWTSGALGVKYTYF